MCSTHQQDELQQPLVGRLHAQPCVEWQPWAAWQTGEDCHGRRGVVAGSGGGATGSNRRPPGLVPCTPTAAGLRFQLQTLSSMTRRPRCHEHSRQRWRLLLGGASAAHIGVHNDRCKCLLQLSLLREMRPT